MHILLEEAPLLVFYFLTLFLSNYKLRLILSTSFSKKRGPHLPSVNCRSLAHSLCSFARSLIAHSLRSFTLCACFARAFRLLHSLTSFVYCAHSLRSFTHLLRIVPSISLASLHIASLYTTLGREL